MEVLHWIFPATKLVAKKNREFGQVSPLHMVIQGQWAEKLPVQTISQENLHGIKSKYSKIYLEYSPIHWEATQRHQSRAISLNSQNGQNRGPLTLENAT